MATTTQNSFWLTRTITRRPYVRHKKQSHSSDDFPNASQSVTFQLDHKHNDQRKDSPLGKQQTSAPTLSVHDQRRFNALLNQPAELTPPDRHISKKHLPKTFVLYHDSQFRYVWDIYILFLLCYVATVSVFVYSFKGALNTSNPFFWIERFLDISFAIDIILNFFTFYHTHPDQDFHPSTRTTIVRYMTTFFLVDLVSTIPWDVVGDNHDDEPTLLMIFRFLRLLRLFKIYRLSQVFRSRHSLVALEVKLRLKYAHLRLVALAVMVCLISHWFACLFYFFGTVRANTKGEIFDAWTEDPTKVPSDHYGRYLVALYFSVYTITTIGYGDIVPGTSIGRTYVILIMLLGAACFAWAISQVSNIYGELRESSAAYRRTMDSLTHLCRVRNVPDNLAIDLRVFLQKYYTYRCVEDEKAILDVMSGDLRDRLLRHMYEAYVKLLVTSFPGTTMSDFDSIYSEISERFARNQDKLYTQGQIADKAFIIKRGAVKITGNKGIGNYNNTSTATDITKAACSNEMSEIIVRDSGVIGVADMAVARLRTHGATVIETSELLEIPRIAITNALQSNQKVWLHLRDQHAKKLWRQAEVVIARRKRLATISEQLLDRVVQMNDEQQIEAVNETVVTDDDTGLDEVRLASEEINSEPGDRPETLHSRVSLPPRPPRRNGFPSVSSSSLPETNEIRSELEQKSERIRFLEQQLFDLRRQLDGIVTALRDTL